jgi:hypothetical protein
MLLAACDPRIPQPLRAYHIKVRDSPLMGHIRAMDPRRRYAGPCKYRRIRRCRSAYRFDINAAGSSQTSKPQRPVGAQGRRCTRSLRTHRPEVCRVRTSTVLDVSQRLTSSQFDATGRCSARLPSGDSSLDSESTCTICTRRRIPGKTSARAPDLEIANMQSTCKAPAPGPRLHHAQYCVASACHRQAALRSGSHSESIVDK